MLDVWASFETQGSTPYAVLGVVAGGAERERLVRLWE
jgi:hypothetical protein